MFRPPCRLALSRAPHAPHSGQCQSRTAPDSSPESGSACHCHRAAIPPPPDRAAGSHWWSGRCCRFRAAAWKGPPNTRLVVQTRSFGSGKVRMNRTTGVRPCHSGTPSRWFQRAYPSTEKAAGLARYRFQYCLGQAATLHDYATKCRCRPRCGASTLRQNWGARNAIIRAHCSGACRSWDAG